MPKAAPNSTRANELIRAHESDALALLRTLAASAAEAAADPTAASADHELLALCDDLVDRRRQIDRITAEWRRLSLSTSEGRQGLQNAKTLTRKMQVPLLRAANLPATTPAGLFAKALAVRHSGDFAVGLAKSLAEDLLTRTELRAVICACADER